MAEPKYRHEVKYQIYFTDYLIISNRIKYFMKLDEHARGDKSYFIRSIYFDTPSNKALNDKLDGVNQREKFRIRLYDLEEDFIKLEKKMKKAGMCLKVSCQLTKSECEKILEGDIGFMKLHKEPLLQELYYKMLTTCLKPKTIVDYDREAYVYGPGNVRVTFDHNIKSGMYVKDIFHSSLPGANILADQMVVLEVKYDEFLPIVIQDLIQTNQHRSQAMSKYAAARMFG